MNKLQEDQRLLEVKKKVEMYENEWMQTVKPENKLQPIQMQKDMLEDEPMMLKQTKGEEDENEQYEEPVVVVKV